MLLSEMSWLVIYPLKKQQVWPKKYSADLHVLHLTTEREIELFEAKPTKDKKITRKACIHHLIYF